MAAKTITQEQAQKLLDFVRELARTEPSYADYSGVGAYLSDNWVNLADYLLQDLGLEE